jgi:hypothetical protein
MAGIDEKSIVRFLDGISQLIGWCIFCALVAVTYNHGINKCRIFADFLINRRHYK